MNLHTLRWTLLASLALLASPSPVLADAGWTPPTVPVRVGEIPEMDACGGWGAIRDQRLIFVHAAPDDDADTIDSLTGGTGVHLCAVSADGKWQGIVYPSAPDQDCGVTSAVDQEQDYAGPCRSGWVPVEDVELLAG